MVLPLTVLIMLSIIAWVCSNYFLWIWWLLCTELRGSFYHFFRSTFRESNWILLSESYWLCFVFPYLSFAKLSIFSFHHLYECYDKADFPINCWTRLEKIFDLERWCIVENIDEHCQDIFHELVIIFCLQFVPTFSNVVSNELRIEKQCEMYNWEKYASISSESSKSREVIYLTDFIVHSQDPGINVQSEISWTLLTYRKINFPYIAFTIAPALNAIP